MSLYASVCNNTVVMWPLFIELIVCFCEKIAQGKFLQHRENTGNFILARMWPPWKNIKEQSEQIKEKFQTSKKIFVFAFAFALCEEALTPGPTYNELLNS